MTVEKSAPLNTVQNARQAALRLVNSILAKSGDEATFIPPPPPSPPPPPPLPPPPPHAPSPSSSHIVQLGPETNPTIDLVPKLFETPAQEKQRNDAAQVTQLKLTVEAKQAWVRVTQLRRERVDVTEALEGLQKKPAVELSQQLTSRLESLARSKDAHIEVALREANLLEAKLSAAKVDGHESNVGWLQAKIAAVDGFKNKTTQLKQAKAMAAVAAAVEQAADMPDGETPAFIPEAATVSRALSRVLACMWSCNL